MNFKLSKVRVWVLDPFNSQGHIRTSHLCYHLLGSNQDGIDSLGLDDKHAKHKATDYRKNFECDKAHFNLLIFKSNTIKKNLYKIIDVKFF